MDKNPRGPQGPGRKMRAAKGGGGGAVTGNDGICRHAVRGAEMIGGGWRVAGAGDVQVDRSLGRDSRWVLVKENR